MFSSFRSQLIESVDTEPADGEADCENPDSSLWATRPTQSSGPLPLVACQPPACSLCARHTGLPLCQLIPPSRLFPAGPSAWHALHGQLLLIMPVSAQTSAGHPVSCRLTMFCYPDSMRQSLKWSVRLVTCLRLVPRWTVCLCILCSPSPPPPHAVRTGVPGI